MSFTFVYKTYAADLQWLYYSLYSVNKYVRDVKEILIYYHNECQVEYYKMLNKLNIQIPVRSIAVGYNYHGYIKQMVVKCMCFKDVTTDYVAFCDSDVIFKKEYSPKCRIDPATNKIIWNILRKDATSSKSEAWRVWEKAVQRMTNEPMTTYYMYNAFPFVVKRSTLEKAYNKFVEIHKKDYDTFCEQLLHHTYKIYCQDKISDTFTTLSTIFEEFEYLGWFSEKYTNEYVFVNGPNTTHSVTQFWSHGGLTDAIRKEIHGYLGM